MQNQYISHNGQACGIMMDQNPNNFHAVGIDKSSFRFMSGPELNYSLYRGQNKFYDLSYPSKYRISNENEILIANLKKIEFIHLLQAHPIIEELENIKIGKSKFSTDYDALAQHYGFATDYMDLTNDKNIAMFFATTYFNSETEKYEVITEDTEVVLYTVNNLHPEAVDRINIVGLQALPRPSVQKAFSVKLEELENFNKLSFVTYEKFICTKTISKSYFNMFEGGSKIFPNDIMDKKAQQVRHSSAISEKALNSYYKLYDIKSKEEKKKITSMLNNFDIKNKNNYLTKRELSSIRKNWAKRRMSFFEKISYRMSCCV